ncbi:NAD(P)-dependent oxidoreductase [Litoricolaceae bacterium]|nr:NAD(P)-dependent oxidoreductase [Litorivicinaceae bacterium]
MVGKKIIIFGGSGFLGRALASVLASRHEVVVADNFSRNYVAPDRRVTVVECDVLDRDAVFSASEGASVIINMAFINGTRNFYAYPNKIAEVALRGQLNVVDAANSNSIDLFIYASSSEVYQAPPTIPTAEAVPLVIPNLENPRYSYGGGKIVGEYLTKYLLNSDINRIVFRPHNIYGRNMGLDHVIPELCKKAIKAKEDGCADIEIIGSLSNTRSFCFIDDFTTAFSLILEAGFTGTVNIGSGLENSVREVIDLLSQLLDFELNPVPSTETHVGSVSRRCPDISILKSLGFVPRTPLIDGLKNVLDGLIEESRS